ncbi:hypothetical protein VP01_1019g6 [Puccinia sorghi]|uniref:Uncharacterized protein n=1 Tax=Puccinia sorghi TaxID=27349 RepID=A0A0L6VW79_9BASI|nr:hypothetical protein VP01_1019g6 [Puccinia sorghi]
MTTPTSKTPTTPTPKNKQATKKKAIPWHRDGVDGGSSSIEIVLNWLRLQLPKMEWGS